MNQSDFLIIGSGVAGLSLALGLADHGRVHIVTKNAPSDSNTNWAQGGIAAVVGDDDSFDLHIKDTIRSGCGLCREDVVEFVIREGPQRVENLTKLGVPFSRDENGVALGLEGGHSRKRIVHCNDLTGREVERTLLERVHEHKNIEVFAYHMAVNLITQRHLRSPDTDAAAVYGAYVLNTESGMVERFVAQRTILASGGAGKVYTYTSNPDVATGDGVAMAFRSGARIANLEFVQFHPTCLFHPEIRSFLLSEALRGEGGKLLRSDGTAFMPDYHSQADLAPRDIVARAADAEMKQRGDKCVYLDMTHHNEDFLRRRFPTIFETLASVNINMAREPIPVVPATHYFCGGVDVNELGETNVGNLLALGEVSHTGLHGANRLASNSLLEALAFAVRTLTGATGDDYQRGRAVPEPLPWDYSDATEPHHAVILEHDWESARRIMWDYVGIVRSDQRLEIARNRMRALRQTVHDLYWNHKLTQDLLELRNIILVGLLVIESAYRRKESRGLHYTESYPEIDDANFKHDTVLDMHNTDVTP